MAWGDKRDRIVAENAAMAVKVEMLEARVAELKEEKAELARRLTNTQEALVSKEAPEAYRDQKYLEEQAKIMANADPEKEKEAARLLELKAKTTGDYLRNMEDNLFHDADDMIEMFTRAAGVPIADNRSLHNNDES